MVQPVMTDQRHRIIYLAALILVFGGLALLRADLVEGAFKATSASIGAGWGTGIKVISEIILFAFIMALTVRALTLPADPATDCLIVLAASFYGYLAEAWGTHAGLWAYYTGEKPPLWIIPGWPIGALVINRLASKAGGLLGRLSISSNLKSGWLYWAWVTLFYFIFIVFISKKAGAAASVLPAVLAASVLFPGRERRTKDTTILLTGVVCVFWADLWGTTNHCWRYYVQTGGGGTAQGILFGLFFDSFVVLAAIKTAESLRRAACRL